MIDLHAHILPGLDHRPRDWDESLAMCRIAVEDGIRTIAATPHVSEEFPNRRERVEEGVDRSRSEELAAGGPRATSVTSGKGATSKLFKV